MLTGKPCVLILFTQGFSYANFLQADHVLTTPVWYIRALRAIRDVHSRAFVLKKATKNRKASSESMLSGFLMNVEVPGFEPGAFWSRSNLPEAAKPLQHKGSAASRKAFDHILTTMVKN